jgi:hypothetical protein
MTRSSQGKKLDVQGYLVENATMLPSPPSARYTALFSDAVQEPMYARKMAKCSQEEIYPVQGGDPRS